jgi:hypothetical protein
MNFGKFIDILWPLIMTVMLLSAPFFVYNFVQRDNECKQRDGILVKSSGGWICIKAETK